MDSSCMCVDPWAGHAWDVGRAAAGCMAQIHQLGMGLRFPILWQVVVPAGHCPAPECQEAGMGVQEPLEPYRSSCIGTPAPQNSPLPL